MKQSHLFTSPRPKRTYPFLVAFDVFCHISICAIGLVLGAFALKMVIMTVAPGLFPSLVQFMMRLFRI